MKTKKEETKEELKSIKVDFSKVEVQVSYEGDPQEVDFRKDIANRIRRITGDFGLEAVARNIYFSESDVEVPEEYIPAILEVVSHNYNVPTQEAFNNLLTINKED